MSRLLDAEMGVTTDWSKAPSGVREHLTEKYFDIVIFHA